MELSEADPHVVRAIEAFRARDLDGLLSELAEGGTFVDPIEAEGLTGGEIREYMADLFEAFPDIDFTVERVLRDDEGGTALVYTTTGTHNGSVQGIPPTGNSIAVPGVSVIAVGDEGITHWQDYWDQQTLAEQLGLKFPHIVPKLPGMVAAKFREVL